jgi:hypothetical protein
MTIVIDIVTNGRSDAPRVTLYPNWINPGSPGSALAAKSAT